MAISGKFGLLYIDDNYSPVVDLSGWSINMSRELFNITDLDDNGWQKYHGEVRGYQVNAKGVLSLTGEDSHNFILRSYFDLREMTMRLYFGNSVPVFLEGKCIIEDLAIISNKNNLMTVSFTFRGIGEIAITE